MAMPGERLRELRRRSFVGQDSEVSLFRAAPAEPGLIFVHGPGGVGKSALLVVGPDCKSDLARLKRPARRASWSRFKEQRRHLEWADGLGPAR
ncbi:hypothetical protein AB0L00_38160 [Actinoallomurus sp. NPDC052308]|uniref:hypothetical protein n=1 Tax=Actinoallomurus sp. NPDC052308 TaxID=3155530 RepID=UPI0034308687